MLAAYAVYLVLTLAAQSFRLVVVPDLTRAAHEGRLAGEARAYGIAFLALAVPVCALVGIFSGPLGELITGKLPPSAAHVASRALVWLVPAGFAQLLAALAASVLAARDSYATAAAGFAGGGVAGVVFFAALAGGHGVISLAWGLALNGAVAVSVPLARLLRERVILGPRGRLDVGAREHHHLHRPGRRLARREVADDLRAGVVLEGDAVADQVAQLLVVGHGSPSLRCARFWIGAPAGR